jgi:outer membrane protein OmpA-like peptidoglycan-associated protein
MRNKSVVYTVKLYHYYLAIVWALTVLSNLTAGAQELAPEPSMIKSIYFGGGSYYISQNQIQELKDFIKSFPGIENYTITVHSHTDNIGSQEYNQMLSEMRSYMSIKELLQLRVPREIISINDFGEFNPVYDNATLEGRLRNRRVDIILWPLETL